MAMIDRPNNIKFDNVKFANRNFAGRATKFKPAGQSSVSIVIEDLAFAERLIQDGWNVKIGKPNPDTGQPDRAYLSVKVSYENRPPMIVLVSNRKKTILDAESIEVLDYADIENVDAIVRPYCWENNGKSGVAAYMKTCYVTIQDDPFGDKYNFDADEEPVPFEED